MVSRLRNKWQVIINTDITGESLYLFLFCVALFVSFIINTTFMSYLVVKYLNYITYLVVGLLLIKIVTFDHYNWWQLIILFGILGLAVISWRKSKITSLMIMTAFVIAARGVDFRKVIHTYLWVNGILLCMTFLYSLIGIISNLMYYRHHIPRFALGIDYPTDLAAYILYFIIAWCFYHYENLTVRDYIVIVIADLLMFLVTNARLDGLMILLFIVAILLTKRADSGKQVSINICKTFWSLSIVLPYAYFLLNYFYSGKNHIMRHIDNLLSGRLSLGSRGLNQYGVTLFGQHVAERGWGGVNGSKMADNQPWKYFFIDSSYMRLLLIYGLIIGIVVVAVVLVISIRSTLKHEYLLPAIMLMITISSLIDQHLLEITFNPFLIALLANNVNYAIKGDNHEQ